MNEQLIQKLVDETGLKDILADHVKKYPGLYQEPIEEFAGLIVRECMLQCIKVENDVELSDYEGGFRDGALLCYQEIKEHFGVEE